MIMFFACCVCSIPIGAGFRTKKPHEGAHATVAFFLAFKASFSQSPKIDPRVKDVWFDSDIE